MFLAVISLSNLDCARREEEKNVVSLTIAYKGRKGMTEDLDEILDSFEKKYHHIKLQRIREERSFYYQKIELMIAGGTAPDVMWMGQGFGDFASRGLFLDIEPIIKNEGFDLSSYYPQVLDMYRYKGVLYGLPYGIDLSCMIYNKQLFNEAGISYPDETWTLDRMLEASKKLTKDTDRDGQIDQYGVYFSEPYLGCFGASLLDEDAASCSLDQPEAIRALQFWVDLGKKHKVSPVQLMYGSFNMAMGVQESFRMGKIAMINGYTWHFSTYQKTVKNFEWDIALFPKGEKREHWTSSAGYTISKNTKHPKEAWLLLKFLTNAESQTYMANTTLPALRKVAEKMARTYNGPPKHYAVLLEAIKYMKPYPRIPNITEIVETKRIIEEYALSGQKSSEDAYKWATEEINKILQEDN